MKRLFLYTLSFAVLFVSWKGIAQTASPHTASVKPHYWQQHVDYKMEIDMDVKTYQYKGKQQIIYTNNSPDVLTRVFYHVYFNALQPGSEMDVRSRTIPDPDRRVGDRISKLQPHEIGYIKVNSLKQDGTEVTHKTVGTILEVTLAKPIQPGESTTFDMLYDAQVPEQIRRSGRNNSEGVALSMTQWYPKLAEYDTEGWHIDPYIAREFYGVWGDFDVKITIDKNYTIGGTGYLQNPNEIGHGYETGKLNVPKTDKLTWHFIAPNVHDFAWAADPQYVHDKVQIPNGPMLHFFYKSTMPKDKLDNWKKLQPISVQLMQFFIKHIGDYPYKQYSVIQGGDGGMEYAMCTLIMGEGELDGTVGTTSHEMAHTWFQFLLATNEAKDYWMDEGFAQYYGEMAEAEVLKTDFNKTLETVHAVYASLAKSGHEQPLTTQADRFNYNQTYSISAYYKGFIFLSQLGYVIGEDALEKTIKTYFNEWAFKHPKPNDFMRVAEKVSGLQLGWYLTDFAQTTNVIDYGIKSVEGNTITLERIGIMPMPLDLTVTYTDGSTEDFYIPLRMMHGNKSTTATIQPDWAWSYPIYTFETKKTVKSVVIDPKNQMADIDRENNKK